MQLAGGIIGAAIGAPFGFAGLGWSIGSTLGGLLAKPEQQVHAQPKMDLRVPGTADGRPIPWIRGAMRVAPDWVWHTDRRATTIRTESGGGGGLLGGLFGGAPKVVTETTTYDMDALFMLDINGGIGISEIYASGELIWRTDSGATAGTIAASNQTDHWSRLTVYTGAADQLPDPDYEAAVGAGHAPAYRGRMTVFIKGLQLGQTGQIPQLEFVVVVDGTQGPELNYFPGLTTNDDGSDQVDTVYMRSLNELWSNDVSHHLSDPPTDRIGVLDLETETFEYVDFPATWPLSDVNNGRFTYGLDTMDAVYVAARHTGGVHRTTLVYRASDRMLIGTFHDALDGVSESTVLGVQPENHTALVSLDSGIAIVSIDDSGMPVAILDLISSSGASNVEAFAADDEAFWLLYIGANEFWKLSAAGKTTVSAGADEKINDELCWAHDTTRNCGYYWSNLGAGSEYLKRINFDDHSLERVNSTPFDSTDPDTPWGGHLIYAEDIDKVIVIDGGVTPPFNAFIIDPDTGAIEETIPIPDSGGTQFSGKLAYTAEIIWGFANETGDPGDGGIGELRLNALNTDCPSVQNVQESLCLRAGLTAGQVNVSPLSAITRAVCCLPWSNISPAREPSETMMGAFFYESTMSGSKVKFVPRGAPVVETIPYADLGAHVAGEADSEDPLALRLANDLETPAFSHINYINLASNYTDGSETTDRLISTSAVTNRPLDVSIGMQPAEAKGVIDTVHRDRASALLRGRISLLRSDYPTLEPTDCITVTGPDDSEYRVRIIQIVDRFPLLECDVVMDDPDVLSDQGITHTEYEAQESVAPPANTVMRLIDTPILQDADDSPGLYVLAKGDQSRWLGALILDSNDDVDFVHRATIEETAIFGTTTTALGDWAGPRVFDFTNKVRVNIGANAELSSSTRALVVGNRAINAFRIGDEVGQFVNAELISEGVYDLSVLLRGSVGTEWAMTGHTAGEQFEILRAAGMRRVSISTAQIAVERYYKGVTRGRPFSSASSRAFTASTAGMKPYSPVRLRISRDASNNATMTIEHRTRYVPRLVGDLGVSIPLSDLDEYRWEIYSDGTFTTLVDTLNSVGTSVEYTAAAQTAAGLTPGDPIAVSVMQKSAYVGVGYPLQRAA